MCCDSFEQVSTQALWYLCRHFFLIYSHVCIIEPDFLPFLNASSAQKWKKTKIYNSEYRAGNITQWFCRAVKLCIISVKIYAAVMVKVTIGIKRNLVWIKVKKSFSAARVTYFFAMRVIGNEQFFNVGLIVPHWRKVTLKKFT